MVNDNVDSVLEQIEARRDRFVKGSSQKVGGGSREGSDLVFRMVEWLYMGIRGRGKGERGEDRGGKGTGETWCVTP